MKNMRLEIVENKILRDCFDTIATIIDEVVLECDSEGMRLRALDRSHITFVGMELKASLFDEYICDEPEKIMVDASELMKVMKRLKPSDILKLESKDNKLILTFAGDSTRTFKLALIDTDYESAQPPKMDPPVNVHIPSGLLEDFLNDMLIFGETVVFSVDEDYFRCDGTNEMGESSIQYLHGESISEFVKSTFNIAKIKDMLKAKKLSSTVKLGLGTDMPLIVEFNINNGEGKLDFLLAPRLSQEE